MKGIKKIFINVLAICLVAISCFGLSACKEDVVKVQLNVGVYNYSEDVKEVENKKFSIDLYSYVAPKTVDAVTKYIKQGYYNDTFFYIIDGGDVDFPNQLMLGDLKMVDGEIVQNDIKPTIKGEFENGGRKGSNLTATKGAVGLWRSWNVFDDQSYDVADPSMNSGRSTLFIPTSSISGYNGWMCIFGKIDLTSATNSATLTALEDAFDDDHYKEYVIYFTGDYDVEKADQNHGLTFNCVEKDYYNEDSISDLHESENGQLACYNPYVIKVPVDADGNLTAKVTSVKIK
ncbi:MAG: peptidylprolyl isomerase [Clostridiales bacterium]|nr:peptidylprolyl isomerase [Clostridiales bacterium]